MKKITFTIAFIIVAYMRSYGQYSDYTGTTNSSTRVAHGISSISYTTGCDMLDFYNNNFKVYTWASSSGLDTAKFAWQLNNGSVTELDLQDVDGITPDVALVHLGNTHDVLYAIVAYKDVTNNYPEWEAYQWNGSAFVYYSSSFTQITGSVVSTAIHVDGDRNGHLVITWDAGGEIKFACGDIETSTPYTLSIDPNFGRLIIGNSLTMTYPDVAITSFDEDDADQVFFSMSELDGSDYHVDGYFWNFSDLYDVGLHSNTIASGTVTPLGYSKFLGFNHGLLTTSINKTSISATERHGFSYKHQVAVAWEEFDGTDWYLYASMTYIVDYSGTVNTDIRNMTWNTVYKDINTGPVIIDAKSDDYIIGGWNYENVTSTTVPPSIEPLVNKMNYDTSLATPNLSAPATYYAVGEPALGSGSIYYPTDVLDALSMAGKQSNDILYFFYDNTDHFFYFKESAPSASPLRLSSGFKTDNKQIIILPNPATTTFTINANGYMESNLTIYDITGRKKYQSTFNEHIALSTNYFKPGTYFIEISNANGNNLRTKLIISK